MSAEETFSQDALNGIHTQLKQSQTHAPFFLINDKNQVLGVDKFDSEAQATIGFIDPSAAANNPGWPLRNLLAYLRALYPQKTSSLRVICWRDNVSEGSPTTGSWKSRFGVLSAGASVESTSRPTAVGWEKNMQGKLAPRVADLAPMMDPTRYVSPSFHSTRASVNQLNRLADQAVDLNLKLMRWRILPSLDLEKVASTRCLLLGAGTLGCYVARTLMVRSLPFSPPLSPLKCLTGLGRPHNYVCRFCTRIVLESSPAAVV